MMRTGVRCVSLSTLWQAYETQINIHRIKISIILEFTLYLLQTCDAQILKQKLDFAIF
jgi:hypothetical protein